MKLQSEINWLNELSELVDNYEISTKEFCCEMGLLRQDMDGSDSFTCCGSYGCGTNYKSCDITKDCIVWQLAVCKRCKAERPIYLCGEYCEECEEKMEEMEEENNEDEDED
jgi:hypothetical protein